ncbi:MAG: transcriptional regulator [Vulcanibacillus sp.]
MAQGNEMDININKFIHERARLLILTHLATKEEKEVTFKEIKLALDMTAGNLSVQLSNLEEAGYIKVEKKIEHKKTVTRISLTAKGYDELMLYLESMDRIIRSIRE